ncbi:MAG: sugar phosphate isomerase/epimerase [Clostridiales bacterium]|nr:sugar phosphate isomerase/epimerase [Clostridiales bacterium]
MSFKFSSILISAMLACTFTSCGQKQAETSLPDKDIALQLYSIREVIGDSAKYADNHVDALAKLKEMGYTAVEAANYGGGKFYGISPEQFKADCEAAGLTPLSSHTTRGLSEEEISNHDFEAAMAWWDEAIAAHKAAGMTYIVSPWGNEPKTLEEAQTLVDYHNAIGAKCKEAGLKYGYHTHSGEFKKIGDSDKVWIEYLVENTDPENFFWQMDVYWAVMAKASPVEYLKKYPGRFALLHIKDKYELGQSGMVNFEPIFNCADEAGMKAYIVEQEGTDGTHSIMEGVAMNTDYLRGADFVKASYAK